MLRFHDFGFAPGLALQFSGFNLTDADNYNEAGGIFGDDLRREGVSWAANLSYKF